MHAVGMRPILVHGGGKSITAAMEEAGLEAHFVQGRRYTDERTLAIAEHVLINQVSRSIIDMISDNGHTAMGLNSLSSCVVFGERLFLSDAGDDGNDRRIDVGLVGTVNHVNAELLSALVEANTVPVIAPIARDASGGKLNINADSVAGHVAAAVHAEKLVLVSDTHGIRTGEDDDSLARHLTKAEIQDLIDRDIIKAGMLPKVESAFTALAGGVNKAHIIDGRIPHALMLEIYTNEGIGTEIVAQ
jgi:acetylglutamate kinase